MTESRIRNTRLPLAWLAALIVAAFAALQLPASAQQGTEENGLLEYERNTVEIVEKYGAGVVAVDVTIAGRTVRGGDMSPFGQLPDFLRDFLPFQQDGQPGREYRLPSRETAGSGFVIDGDGHILTNYHVIAGALEENQVDISEGSSIRVSFPDSSPLDVEVVGASSIYDLALLRLADPDQLPDDVTPIELGDTDALRPGQKAIAIGNPFGFESTVTLGIVSAVGRHFPYIGEVEFPLVQTDAPINPGNSGGPLLDSAGRLIGVNTAIIPTVSATGDRGNLGIGFAVPADIVASVLPELREGGISSIPTRPRLGVTIRDLSAYPPEVLSQLGLPGKGVGVLEVEPGSAAEEAGLKGSGFSINIRGVGEGIEVPGDVIVEVDGQPVERASELQTRIVGMKEGDVVTLGIIRDGERIDVDVPLKKVPSPEDDSGN